MANSDLLREPLDPTTDEGKKILSDLQGNILRSHARDDAMHLFINFGRPTNEAEHAECLSDARGWLGDMVSSHITSAEAQEADRDKEQLFTMIALSSQGYWFLNEPRPRDGAFRDGLRERQNQLNDPPFEDWEETYMLGETEIHALVIVATKNVDPAAAKAELDAAKAHIESGLGANGSILVDERGRQKKDEHGRAVEHFGYADGVSQPQLIAKDGDPVGTKFDQRSPLKIVLEEDRHGDGGYGSYLVYRKLAQNVESFNFAVLKTGIALGLHDPDNRDDPLVGAMVIGRWKNGTPLATHDKPKQGYKPSEDEDFNYEDDDEDGNKCPMHAHIRKVNPRGELPFIVDIFAREGTRRIARRGITYGEGTEDVGLIFMCFQHDIKDQFEFIQGTWANNRNFRKPLTGIDPVIGQAGEPQVFSDFPNWPRGYDSKLRRRLRFEEHVTFLGGEYFFAPSMSGLKELARLS